MPSRTNIRLQAFGADEEAHRVAGIGDRAGDIRPLLPGVRREFLAAEDEQFRTHKGWKRGAPATIAEKARHGWGPEPLEATGRLRYSLTRAANPDAIAKADASSITLGTRDPVARIHKGAKPSNPMPRRNPIPVRKALRTDFIEDLRGHLLGTDQR